MNCIVTGSNVRILARTVNFLSRIGQELYLEVNPTGLMLKTMNASKTAYAVANFPTRFFIQLNQGPNNDVFEENHCKVAVKPCLKIFKSLSKIHTCKIWLILDRSKIVFQFKCKSDIVKTHIICLLEHEHISSVRVPPAFPNQVVGEHKVFNSILNYFHSSIEEITFKITSNKIEITNHIENLSKDTTSMRSKCVLSDNSFKLFEIEEETALTFCYKEFKAMTCFSDLNRLDVEINFGSPGMPLLVRMQKDGIISINLIMGTLKPDRGPNTTNIRKKKRNRKADRVTSHISNTTSSMTINTCNTETLNDKEGTTNDDARKNKDSVDDFRLADLENEFNAPMSIDDFSICNSIQNIPGPSSKQATRRTVHETPLHNLNKDPPSAAPQNQRRSNFTSAFDGIQIIPRERSTEHIPKSGSIHFSVAEAINPAQPKIQEVAENDSESYDLVFVGNTDDSTSQTPGPAPFAYKSKQGPSYSKDLFSASAGRPRRQPTEDLFSNRNTASEPSEESEAKRRKMEKVRKIFKKCFVGRVDPNNMPGCSQVEVYAEDSDPDDQRV